MNSCEMRFPDYDARSNRGLIRWELFLHSEVRDVLLTSREDTLRVVFRGSVNFAGWVKTLVDAGFPAPCSGARQRPREKDRPQREVLPSVVTQASR
jgi:hypothetical protein